MDDVVHVIDCGYSKSTTYNAETNTSSLETHVTAQSNVRQRRGRAGRCQAGNFFKMYNICDYIAAIIHVYIDITHY